MDQKKKKREMSVMTAQIQALGDGIETAHGLYRLVVESLQMEALPKFRLYPDGPREYLPFEVHLPASPAYEEWATARANVRFLLMHILPELGMVAEANVLRQIAIQEARDEHTKPDV